MPYSYPSLPHYVHTLAVTTMHCKYIYCMPATAITCTAPFISTALHLAKYISVDVNAQSKVRWWALHCSERPNVTKFLTAVLSFLNCLYKTGQFSSYHPATICVSVLCPIPSLRAWLPRTAVIYQAASIWPFKVFRAASTTVMLCGLTQQTCSNVTYICTASDTI